MPISLFFRITSALLIVAIVLGCSKHKADKVQLNMSLTDQQLRKIAERQVFFGHKSVGDNIVQGLRELMAQDPRLKINIVKGGIPATIPGPALVEFHVGQNGLPSSKDAAFAAALEGVDGNGAVAMYKYCYVDMTASTDVSGLFAGYGDNIRTLKAKHPGITFVHVTMPLTTVEPGWKAAVKSALGRNTRRDLAVKRNQFNDLLRNTYAGKEPIFDLAEAESTRPDGSRSYFTAGARQIYTLAPEYTTDGGHLNATGRQVMAAKFLETLVLGSH